VALSDSFVFADSVPRKIAELRLAKVCEGRAKWLTPIDAEKIYSSMCYELLAGAVRPKAYGQRV
jgi:hypothetical protein